MLLRDALGDRCPDVEVGIRHHHLALSKPINFLKNKPTMDEFALEVLRQVAAVRFRASGRVGDQRTCAAACRLFSLPIAVRSRFEAKRCAPDDVLGAHTFRTDGAQMPRRTTCVAQHACVQDPWQGVFTNVRGTAMVVVPRYAPQCTPCALSTASTPSV